jgi:hypothetical protein
MASAGTNTAPSASRSIVRFGPLGLGDHVVEAGEVVADVHAVDLDRSPLRRDQEILDTEAVYLLERALPARRHQVCTIVPKARQEQ